MEEKQVEIEVEEYVREGNKRKVRIFLNACCIKLCFK
jgi:hypothetical protein